MAEQLAAAERVFNALKRLRPNQRVIAVGICQVLTPLLKVSPDPRAEILGQAIDAVCARFDSKGRARKR
ncbi:MAG: hypothetical protein FVQ81_18360 [Candidatus Glassbacteria bacterium]|nr:hypothetical protein [Candidatus Glassbacteria bacterium]